MLDVIDVLSCKVVYFNMANISATTAGGWQQSSNCLLSLLASWHRKCIYSNSAPHAILYLDLKDFMKSFFEDFLIQKLPMRDPESWDLWDHFYLNVCVHLQVESFIMAVVVQFQSSIAIYSFHHDFLL